MNVLPEVMSVQSLARVYESLGIEGATARTLASLLPGRVVQLEKVMRKMVALRNHDAWEKAPDSAWLKALRREADERGEYLVERMLGGAVVTPPSESPTIETKFLEVLENYRADVISASFITDRCPVSPRVLSQLFEDQGTVTRRVVKIDGSSVRLTAFRNVRRWRQARPLDWRQEYLRGIADAREKSC